MKPVWIVDDDRSIRWVLEKALAREQIPFKSFASATEALSCLDEAGEVPQVLLSDIRMTGDLIFPEGAGAVFRGGIILPGYDLMRQSLYRNAAQLPLAEGHWQAQPRNTHDAIVSGCLQAMAGAVERLHRQLPPEAPCVLSGGTADLLAPLLEMPVLRLDNLVLEGLARVAEQDAP